MSPEQKQSILDLQHNQSVHIPGYFNVILGEVKNIETETYKHYDVITENQGVRITNNTKPPRDNTTSLRRCVLTALEELTEENPVTIPPGIQASQYAYAHARERGLRYKITPGGMVSLAKKQEETSKIDLLKRLLRLEKDETITEQVTQSYLRKVEDVSGYSFLLNDGAVTRLK